MSPEFHPGFLSQFAVRRPNRIHQHITQVFRWETYALGYAGQHPRAKFFTVVKCKYDVAPMWAGKDSVEATRLPLDGLPDSQQGCQHSARFD